MSDPDRPDEDGEPDQDGTPQRTDLFRYLTSARSTEYRQIMDLFTGPLLGDLSAADGAARCEKLERRGNLIRGVRDARVPTVRDFLRSRTRYQASKLGGRVHRDTEGVMAAGDGAREVARELLGATVELLVTVPKTAGAVQISTLAGLTPTGLSMLFD